MKRSAKTFWLTGGSSGIGLALLEKLLERGDTVIATVRKPESLNTLKAAFNKQLEIVPCDLSSQEDLTRLPSQLTVLCNKLDGLILNAGVCEYVDADEMETEMFRRVMEVNYFAAIECVQIALPFLLADHSSQSQGLSTNDKKQLPQIIGVSSLSTKTAFTRAQAYGSSKAAFRYFLEAMRIDLHKRVDVSIVSPGFVKTPMTDANDFSMPFMLNTDQAAQEILKAIDSRPLHYSFPKRLSIPLTIASWLPSLWYKKIAPALSKQETQQKAKQKIGQEKNQSEANNKRALQNTSASISTQK